MFIDPPISLALSSYRTRCSSIRCSRRTFHPIPILLLRVSRLSIFHQRPLSNVSVEPIQHCTSIHRLHSIERNRRMVSVVGKLCPRSRTRYVEFESLPRFDAPCERDHLFISSTSHIYSTLHHSVLHCYLEFSPAIVVV